MKTTASRLWRVLPLIAAMAMSGCSTIEQANHGVVATQASVTAGQAQLRAHAPQPVVRVQPGAWLMGDAVQVRRQPAALEAPVQMATAQPLTLAQAAMTITQQTGMPVQVASNIRSQTQGASGSSAATTLPALPGQQRTALRLPSLPGVNAASDAVVINYSGPLKGLLDLLAAQTHTYWRYDDSLHGVRFFLTETKVFEVNALPGQTTMASTITNAGNAGMSGTSNSISTGGTSSQSAGVTVNLDPYKAIEDGVKTVLKQSGADESAITSVSVDANSGQVIVTATPPELDAVAQYVATINQQMEKNVLVDVHVYAVTLNKADNFALNVNAALSSLMGGSAGKLAIAGAAAASTSLGGQVTGSIVNGNLSAGALAQALSSYGRVALVTSGSVIALNGQPSPLQVSQQNGYLASSTTTSTANVGSSTSLTPGTVISGFSGSFLPMVRGDRIFLEYALNLTQNLGFLTVSSNGSAIQVPNTASQTLANRVALQSGDTVVLAGFEQTGNQTTGQADVGDGAMGGSQSRTALVITMHVVNLGS